MTMSLENPKGTEDAYQHIGATRELCFESFQACAEDDLRHSVVRRRVERVDSMPSNS